MYAVTHCGEALDVLMLYFRISKLISNCVKDDAFHIYNYREALQCHLYTCFCFMIVHVMADWAAHTICSKMTLLSCWLLAVHHKTENTAIP